MAEDQKFHDSDCATNSGEPKPCDCSQSPPIDVSQEDVAALKSYIIKRSQDPRELPDARQRALMACLVIPNAVQKWMVEINAIEPLLDSLEATILAAEKHARENV